MADTGTTVRIVPSGKVYRQMFEAQVQLNRSLTKITRDGIHKPGRTITDVPIVQLSKDDVEHGILGSRQRTWADGFPNDPYVENPVVYKQYAEYVSTQMKEPDSSVAGKEVRGLPDIVAPAKEMSNIIERIAASRKERHEAAVEEMYQELTVINADLEPLIEESSQQLLTRLEDDDQEIARQLAKFEKDDDLLTFTLEGLDQLWDEIQGHSQHRQGWITQLDETLKQAEDDRMEMIYTVFKDYAKTLEKIAYVLLPDLQRFLNKESQLINQTVLSNRRAYGDLFVRLMSTDIERERNQHIQWKRRMDDWKTLNTELAIQRFSKYMQTESVVAPPGVQKVLHYMITEQDMLSSKRLELIDHLRDLKPPSSTKTSVYHWNKGVQDVSVEIDNSSQLHLSSLHKEYEIMCQIALDEIDTIKTDLVDRGVCTAGQAQSVVEKFMIPIVGDRQRIYEETLETMEKNLEEHNKTTTEQLKSLFKYAQGAAHVWDVHEIGLARQERALQEKLEQSRQQHDNQNQDKEAHLDIIMDRMRQDATEKALKDSLSRGLDMLEKIRIAYEVFHTEQTSIVKGYPTMVRGELGNFDEAVCRFFTVSRRIPQEEEEASVDDAEDGTRDDDDSDGQLLNQTTPPLLSDREDNGDIITNTTSNGNEQPMLAMQGEPTLSVTPSKKDRRKKYSMKPAAIDVNFVVGLSASARKKQKEKQSCLQEVSMPIKQNHNHKPISYASEVNEQMLDTVKDVGVNPGMSAEEIKLAAEEKLILGENIDLKKNLGPGNIGLLNTIIGLEETPSSGDSSFGEGKDRFEEHSTMEVSTFDHHCGEEMFRSKTCVNQDSTPGIKCMPEITAFSEITSSTKDSINLEENDSISSVSMQCISEEYSRKDGNDSTCIGKYSSPAKAITSTQEKFTLPTISITMVEDHETEGENNMMDGGRGNYEISSPPLLSLSLPGLPISGGASGLDVVSGQKCLHLERTADRLGRVNDNELVLGDSKEINDGREIPHDRDTTTDIKYAYTDSNANDEDQETETLRNDTDIENDSEIFFTESADENLHDNGLEYNIDDTNVIDNDLDVRPKSLNQSLKLTPSTPRTYTHKDWKQPIWDDGTNSFPIGDNTNISCIC